MFVKQVLPDLVKYFAKVYRFTVNEIIIFNINYSTFICHYSILKCLKWAKVWKKLL